MVTPEAPAGLESAPTPGRPDGCTCGECAVRRQHDPQDPKHQRCDQHGRCLACDGCIPCEAEAEREREIGRLAREYPDRVRRAQRAVNDVRWFVARLIELADIETAEGPEGEDALTDLDEALHLLRDVKRIADARRALEDREVYQ